jgi:hypothetical protein
MGRTIMMHSPNPHFLEAQNAPESINTAIVLQKLCTLAPGT